MNSYVNTLAKYKKDYKSADLKVVIILSKADKLKSTLPDELKDYLDNDPFNIRLRENRFIDGKFMDDYMQKLYQTSGEIRKWFINQPGGQLLVNKAKRENIRLEFTMVSSTGTDPGPNATMLVDINPIRVLDPYFLVLDFYSRGG